MTKTDYQKVEGRIRNLRADRVKLNNMKMQLDELLNNLGPQSPGTDFRGSETNKISDPTSDTVLGLSEIAQRDKMQIEKLEKHINQLEDALKALTERQYKVIERHLMDDRALVEIASDIDIDVSERTCRRDKEKAMDSLIMMLYPRKREMSL